jgi:hypothetical protein
MDHRLAKSFELLSHATWSAQPLFNRLFCPDNMTFVEFSGSFNRCVLSGNNASPLGALS